jgi:hypothetical protein
MLPRSGCWAIVMGGGGWRKVPESSTPPCGAVCFLVPALAYVLSLAVWVTTPWTCRPHQAERMATARLS